MYDLQLNEVDRQILSWLEKFLPDRIFDAHAHLYRLEQMAPLNPLCKAYGPADAAAFLADQVPVYGSRRVQALFLPTPAAFLHQQRSARDAYNTWLVSQLQTAPDCVCAPYVIPGDTAKDIEAMLTHPNVKALACSHVTAPEGDQATPEAYLPESAWQVADAHGLAIAIHLVRDKALADPENLSYIQTMAAKYPNAKAILLHGARGFASWTVMESVRELKELPNIYYDIAAICDPATMFELVRQAGADHVMWGSDYVVDRIKGRPINCGTGFTWVYRHTLPESVSLPVGSLCCESLLAFYQACLMLDADKQTVSDIFRGNACRLFGLEKA